MELIRARSMRLPRPNPVVSTEPEPSSGGGPGGIHFESKRLRRRIMKTFNVKKDSRGRRCSNSVRQMCDHLAAAERSLVVHRSAFVSCLFDALLHVQCHALHATHTRDDSLHVMLVFLFVCRLLLSAAGRVCLLRLWSTCVTERKATRRR